MKTKKFFLTLFILGGLTIAKVTAVGNVQVTFKYKFINVLEGYDHISRLTIYIDGNVAGTSSAHRESAENTFSIQFSKGFHTLRAVIETEYEGTWEEHTIANGYSIDCLYEKAMKFNKKNTNVIIDFDINLGTVIKKK